MKYCSNCGKEVSKNAKFCNSCGASLKGEVKKQNNSYINKKDVAICVILSIVTCGLYLFYWIYSMNEDVNKITGENEPSSGVVILLFIVTCGLYGIYWNYQIGKRIYNAGDICGITITDNSILYLILSIFNLSIVNYCLIQSDLNKFAE